MRIGICTKCGNEGKVVMHHTKGYEGDNKDFVLPYCQSCHKKIHLKARNEGRCVLTPEEANKLSRLSSRRRIHKEQGKYISFHETLISNIQLTEIIDVWPNNIYYSAYFRGNNGKKLYEMEI